MFKKIKVAITQNILNSFLFFTLLIILSLITFSIFILNNKSQAPQALIAPHITMGKLILKVNNIKDMENFYTNLLGMQILSKSEKQISLGFDNEEVLQLLNTPDLKNPGANDPGLNQIAIVFNSRPALATALQKVLQSNPSLYQGGTGRGAIGEAFYVIDPMGNVLELYYDTDPSTWPRSTLGNVEGNQLPIDINQYIQQYSGKSGDEGMKLGHLQIRIGDITKGKDFYLNKIGFYKIPSLINGDSIFMSDGYYHHDLVINQAQGYDGDNLSRYLGLYGFSFYVPNKHYLNKLKSRLGNAGVKYKNKNNSIELSDPWGIEITVGVRAISWTDNFIQ